MWIVVARMISIEQGFISIVERSAMPQLSTKWPGHDHPRACRTCTCTAFIKLLAIIKPVRMHAVPMIPACCSWAQALLM